MRYLLLWGFVVFYLLTGLYVAVSPHEFYENAPGVTDTGPYNMHFIRDVGFAFVVSALGIAYGLARRLKPLIIFGTAWLAMHGLFHLILWFIHSDPTSESSLIDLVIVVLPAAVVTYLCITYKEPLDA
jgi:hypothetical protein